MPRLDYTDETLRQTGRTTRAIKDAMGLVMTGSKVIYLVPHPALCSYVMHIVLDNYGGLVKSRSEHGVVHLESLGTFEVKAIRVQRDIEGELHTITRGTTAMLRFDHTVMEALERCLINWYSRADS